MQSETLKNLRILEIHGANRIHAAVDTLTKRENRPRWAVTIKTSGSTIYYCRDKTHLCDPNHVCILPAGCSYAWKSSGGECLMIEFDAPGTDCQIFSFRIKDPSQFIGLFCRIEKMRMSEGRNFSCLSDLYRLLSLFLDERNVDYAYSHRFKLIAPAVGYMREHFAEPDFSVGALFERASVSEAYFRRIFLSTYGVSPAGYLQMLRMNKAAELLKSDYGSVSAVAEAVGYRSLYHFSKMFKQYFGICPTEYK